MRDAERSQVHMTKPWSALFYCDWLKTRLEFDSIAVPEEHQPANPDDDDDVITHHGPPGRPTRPRERAWKDLGLKELMEASPGVDKTVVEWPKFPAAGPSTEPRSNRINWTHQKIARS